MGKDAQDKKPDLYGNSADFGPPGVGNHEIADSSSIPICGLVGIMGFSHARNIPSILKPVVPTTHSLVELRISEIQKRRLQERLMTSLLPSWDMAERQTSIVFSSWESTYTIGDFPWTGSSAFTLLSPTESEEEQRGSKSDMHLKSYEGHGGVLVHMAIFISPFTILAICLLWAVSNAAYVAVADIKPAVAIVAETEAAGAPLQSSEIRQLTDEVVDRIASDELTAGHHATAACKIFPGDPGWPVESVWNVFNALLGNALIPTKPLGAPYPTANYWPIFQGRTCKAKNDASGSECTIGGYPAYAVNITSVAQMQLAINFARTTNMRLVIKNTGHCYLGKSLGAGALSLWMHNMRDIDFLPDYKGPGYSGPALKLAAGVTVREAYEAAEKYNVTILGAISWSVGYAGGMITGGGQNPLAGIYGMAADHVVAFQLVTADGRLRTVSEDESPTPGSARSRGSGIPVVCFMPSPPWEVRGGWSRMG
ncbi:FAD binding domain-containing protein [Pyricularia oryzae 70-15]|uniref:FAD binding domain-containing protein n=3 Tax=Pyricularia oryzae TaxID=318829 RepID=G5EHB0_PYRO7|nr:FAD binding domain-containing protein [Pyricularia oryzae 70-15]EAQ71479.1 hypothetical protein MGCH7_ch7g886 [Pyricularia oryzae 70-15]EHA45847.1 FAD binding domain-containing protein [Pyricularia oryzae 70-15]ELQ41003.1 FAD binding domain-containing protein [Pyricularia oryzae Y34]